MPPRFEGGERVVREFRVNGGRVGGVLEGTPLLLLHHSGARSGRDMVTPLAYQAVGEDFAVFASRAGDSRHPDWYYNLVAHPGVEIEVGAETVAVTATTLRGEARDQVWERQKALMPLFVDYERKTAGIRRIPVILLTRRPAA
jgi:deazaflavin-dependent oxidoreductase (nitroreductase family)